MTKATFLLILTIISGTASAVLGMAAYQDLLPAAYAAWTGGVTFVCLLILAIVGKIGDAVDDGQINGSYDPSAKSPPPRSNSNDSAGGGTGRGPLAIALLACCLATLALPGCATRLSPAQQQQLWEGAVRITVGFGQIGLEAAAQRGLIEPGDAMLISNGAAILSSAAETRAKIVALKDLGVQAAVDKGVLQEGDRVFIQEASAVIERELPPVSAPATTAAKQPVTPAIFP